MLSAFSKFCSQPRVFIYLKHFRMSRISIFTFILPTVSVKLNHNIIMNTEALNRRYCIAYNLPATVQLHTPQYCCKLSHNSLWLPADWMTANILLSATVRQILKTRQLIIQSNNCFYGICVNILIRKIPNMAVIGQVKLELCAIMIVSHQ